MGIKIMIIYKQKDKIGDNIYVKIGGNNNDDNSNDYDDNLR